VGEGATLPPPSSSSTPSDGIAGAVEAEEAEWHRSRGGGGGGGRSEMQCGGWRRLTARPGSAADCVADYGIGGEVREIGVAARVLRGDSWRGCRGIGGGLEGRAGFGG
jgi:hypothetical protein